jgi:hypothetical protein
MIAWVNELARPTTARLNHPVLRADRFQRACAGSANANHPAALTATVINQLGRFRLNLIIFRVHLVFLNILYLNRPESTQTHIEQNLGHLNAVVLNTLQKFRRKMQTGRGRRC